MNGYYLKTDDIGYVPIKVHVLYNKEIQVCN